MTKDDQTGWAKAAQILETLTSGYDQCDDLARELPDGFRAVEVANGDDYQIEKETEYKPFWVPVAEFTEEDAKYEWADELQSKLGDDYRCVVTDDGVFVEQFVTE